MLLNQEPLFFLETDRLLLRRMRRSDISFLINLWSDPEVTRYMGGPRDKEWLKKEFEESLPTALTETYDLWPVTEKITKELVGHCGLLPKEIEGKPEIEINYIFSKVTWGRGYATEMSQALIKVAFTKMGLRRLVALIDPANTPSEHVAQKVGMHLEKVVIRPGGIKRKLYIVERKM